MILEYSFYNDIKYENQKVNSFLSGDSAVVSLKRSCADYCCPMPFSQMNLSWIFRCQEFYTKSRALPYHRQPGPASPLEIYIITSDVSAPLWSEVL